MATKTPACTTNGPALNNTKGQIMPPGAHGLERLKKKKKKKKKKRVYMSEIAGGNVRGRPPVKWRDRVQEYVRERGEGSLRNLEQARKVCQDRDRWRKRVTKDRRI